MDNDFFSPDQLALGIKLIIEKNRNTLTVTEINLLEDVLINLKKLDNSDKKQFNFLSIDTISKLIKFFCNNEYS